MTQKHIETFLGKLNIFSKKNILLLFFILFSFLLLFFTSPENIKEAKIAVPLAMAQEEEGGYSPYFPFQSTIDESPATQFLAQTSPDPPPCVCPCGGCTGSCGTCSDKYRTYGGYAQHQVRNCVGCCPKRCASGSWHYHEWCGDNTKNGFEECDGSSSPSASSCTSSEGYEGKKLCEMCDWQHTLGTDSISCSSLTSYNSSNCEVESTCTPIDWCGDGTKNNPEDCDGNDMPTVICYDAPGYEVYEGLHLCGHCDWQYLGEDGSSNDIQICDSDVSCTPSGNQSSCAPTDGRTCEWETYCTSIDWCGDNVKNGPEECDGLDGTPSACEVQPLIAQENDGLSNTIRYDGLYLCSKCDWKSYDDRDGDPSDSELCSLITTCNTTPSCGTLSLLWYQDSPEPTTVTGTCLWDTGAECTPIDWCGDGNVNGPELFCDIHTATGTVDFDGETCASKVCSDIDVSDLEDKSLYSKSPGCNAAMASVSAGSLTCVNTCRHIYTVPGCNFPLNATGVDLYGAYIYVTDSSLWSLQIFSVYTPPTSLINTQKLKAIYYFDSEPLSVYVVGNYAFVGTKGQFSIVNINQFNKADEWPDAPGPFPPLNPYKPKGVPYPFFEEQPPTIVSIATLGEVNDVHIVGNYAYLAIGRTDAVGPAAIQIINISDLTAPTISNSYSYPNTMGGVRSIDVQGNYVYVSYNNGSAGTASIDYFLSATLALQKSVPVGNSTSSIDIALNSSGNDFAYIDGLSTFHSVDVNTPNIIPSVVTTDNINLGVPANETLAMDINDAGTFAYVSVQNIGLRSVNITDPLLLTYGDTFTAPTTTSTIVDIIVNPAGEYAYTAGLDLGLVIFKLNDSCGDDIASDFEVCDGTDLRGMFCSNISPYVEGDLGCGPFCNEFDVSDCVACVNGDFYCPAGCTNPPDRDCPACTGVICNTPGNCEAGAGLCKSVGGFPVCVYADDPNACSTPGVCQVGVGRCDKLNGNCYYDDDAVFCDAGDGDVCTGDVCVSPDGGLSSTCMAGENICEGLVPCGRMVNNPATAWDDTDSCDFCYGTLLLNQGMNFLTTIAGIVAVLALIITGFLFITSTGNVERKNSAKTMFKTVLIGFIILFLSWLIIDFVLSVLGYIDPLGGKWNVTCE